MSHNLWTKASNSALETYQGCAWVFSELISAEAKADIVRSLSFLVLATMAGMATPFLIQYVIDAHGTGDTNEALLFLTGIGLAGIIGTIANSLQDHFREKVWIQNFYTVRVGLVNRMFRRSLNEIISEDSEVGPEQIDSVIEKVRTILYMFLFESSIVIATIAGATAFLFVIDLWVGVAAVLLTLFNITWFFFINASLDERMQPIDKDFRRATRRLVEKLSMALSVKSGGVEQKIEEQIGDELKKPLAADFAIWGIWFQWVDVSRRLVNTIAPVAILMFGVTSTDWSSGTVASVSSLVFMISREYGFIGQLMRHLASQVARIKATREALSIPPAFNYDEGIEYKRGSYAH